MAINTRCADITTKKVAQYIKERGIKLSVISNATGIPYGKLHRSFNENRALTADELLEVCFFIEVDPRKFKAKDVKQVI